MDSQSIKYINGKIGCEGHQKLYKHKFIDTGNVNSSFGKKMEDDFVDFGKIDTPVVV